MTDINRREFLKCTVAALAAAQVASAGAKVYAGDPARRKPNVVYVFGDQWRAQATGYAGDPNVKTPNLDLLASQSVNFQNAVSICPVCTPYRASLMTGRYPLTTGMFFNDLSLPSEELCMAEIFKAAGYDTGYIGKWHLDGHGRSSFIPKERRQGFDYWKVLECTHDYNNSFYYAGDDTTKRKWDGYDAYAQTKDAQAYIRDHAGSPKPFLLVISYGGPHFPHGTAPDELKSQYIADSIKLRPNVPKSMRDRARKEAQGYYAHCTAIDRCIGDLQSTLKEAGLAENTIFVFTSDHGEMLGSQGQPPCEKQRPWDESILVPFLVSFPAVTGRKGRTVRTPIDTPDILPTLLSLAGIDIPGTVEGEDLSRLIKAEKPAEDRAALIMSVYPFAGYHGGNAFRGIRTARYTYVRNEKGPWLLYDNDTDPYQMANLVDSAEHAGLKQELEEKLRAKLKETRDEFLPRQRYIEAWGYQTGPSGDIPYTGSQKVQSPANRPK